LKEKEEYRKTILSLLPLIWSLDGYYVSRREMKMVGRWLNDKKDDDGMRDGGDSSNFQYNLNILFPPPSTNVKKNDGKNDNMVNDDDSDLEEEEDDEMVDVNKNNKPSSKLSLSNHVSSSFSLPTTSTSHLSSSHLSSSSHLTSHLPSTNSTKTNENKKSEVEEKREYFLNHILFSMPRRDEIFDEYRLNYLLDEYLSTTISSSTNQPSSFSNNKKNRRSSFQVDGKSYNLSSHIISLILHLPSHILVDLEVLMIVELIYSIPPQVR